MIMVVNGASDNGSDGNKKGFGDGGVDCICCNNDCDVNPIY